MMVEVSFLHRFQFDVICHISFWLSKFLSFLYRFQGVWLPGQVIMVQAALILLWKLVMSTQITVLLVLWFYQGDMWWVCVALCYSCSYFTMETCDENVLALFNSCSGFTRETCGEHMYHSSGCTWEICDKDV